MVNTTFNDFKLGTRSREVPPPRASRLEGHRVIASFRFEMFEVGIDIRFKRLIAATDVFKQCIYFLISVHVFGLQK